MESPLWLYELYNLQLPRGSDGNRLTEFLHMAHFWMSYGRCTMPGSPMGRSEGLPRLWTGQVPP